jgi:ABC-2 type transport system permease protein
MRTLRLLTVGGVIAYRALFNWTTPAMFVGTLLVSPVFQLLFFVYLGRTLHVGDDLGYLVGNAVLSAALACVYGGTMAVANERRYGTLGPLLLSPLRRAAVFGGRALPYAVNGVLISAFTLTVGALLLRIPIGVRSLPGLALAICVGALSCSFFGLTLGSIGLRFRDVWLVSNVADAVLLLVSGVNVAPAALPPVLRAAGALLPLRHAATAAREAAGGAPLARLVPPLGAELGLAAGYALLAIALLALFERGSRRHATLDVL